MIKAEDYRALGSTGLRISPIGLGSVKFGRDTDVKYPRAFKIPDDHQLTELLALSLDLGINFIDTAPAYGNSESRIGKLIQAQRNQWCLCTKVGEYYQDGESRFDFSAITTRNSVENSLRELKTDYLDLVLVHSDGDDENIIQHSDVLATLGELKRKGWIRSIGMSTKTLAGGLRALDETDVVMLTLNEVDQSQTEVIKTAQIKNKGILAKKALASGHTTNPSQALNFAVNFPGVTSVILGTINPGHLQENVDKLKLDPTKT